jgi:hypothetical protein
MTLGPGSRAGMVSATYHHSLGPRLPGMTTEVRRPGWWASVGANIRPLMMSPYPHHLSQMTGHELAAAEVAQGGDLGFAAVDGVGAAGVEMAAGRRAHGTWDVALHD